MTMGRFYRVFLVEPSEKKDRDFEGSKTMFRRILVPLDGSQRAERALSVAARLARASGGSLILLQVLTSPIELAWEAMEAPVRLQEAFDRDQIRAVDYFERLVASDKLAGLEITKEVLSGAPAQAILSVAHSSQVDLIVLCSHGYTGMTRWVLGSVAEKVARHAPVPVLVLREGGPVPAAPRPSPARPLRALIALDGSVRAKAAIEPTAHLIAALAAPAEGALHLAQVVKPALPDTEDESFPQGDGKTGLQKAKEYLSAIADQVREDLVAPAGADLKLRITWSVAVDTDVAPALIRLAENGEDAEGSGVFGGCDIIVMATHGYSGYQHWAMGSITERVLLTTKLPLFIVRPPNITDKSNVGWESLAMTAM